MAKRIAVLSFFSTGAGVPLGAYMPCHTFTSKPFKPCSSKVGTLGNAASVVAQGGDPIKALQSGAVGVAAGLITDSVPGFDSLGKSTQAAITNAVSAQLTGKSPTDALIASARNMAISMATDSALPADVGPNTRGFVNTVAGTVLPQVGGRKKRKR